MKKCLLILTLLNYSISFSTEKSTSSSSSSCSVSAIESSSPSISLKIPGSDDIRYNQYLSNYDKTLSLVLRNNPSLSNFPPGLTSIFVDYGYISYDQWQINGQELIEAVKNNDNEKAIELLNSDQVDPNARDRVGYTALFYANSKEIADLLIKKGANVNIISEHSTALTYQIQRIKKRFRAIEKYGSIDNEETIAAIDSYSIIKSLIDGGAHTSNIDTSLASPLYSALNMYVNDLEMVYYYKIDPTHKEINLDLLINIISLLINHGAKISEKQYFELSVRLINSNQVEKLAKLVKNVVLLEAEPPRKKHSGEKAKLKSMLGSMLKTL